MGNGLLCFRFEASLIAVRSHGISECSIGKSGTGSLCRALYEMQAANWQIGSFGRNSWVWCIVDKLPS